MAATYAVLGLYLHKQKMVIFFCFPSRTREIENKKQIETITSLNYHVAALYLQIAMIPNCIYTAASYTHFHQNITTFDTMKMSTQQNRHEKLSRPSVFTKHGKN